MKKERSFTLVEVLIVLAVIGLLASIVLIAVRGVRQRAKVASGEQFSSSIHHALGADAAGIWNFDNPADLGKDSSGNGNNASLVQGFIATTDGKIRGGAKKIVGFQNIIIPDSDSLDGMEEGLTVEFWLKPVTTLPSSSVINKSASYMFIIVGGGSGGIAFQVFHSVAPPSTAFTVQNADVMLNNWVHLAGTFDRSSMKIYINGKEPSSYTTQNALPNAVNNSDNPLFIGDGLAVDSLLDEVRIYRKGLSQAEIEKHYAEGLEKRNIFIKK